MRLFDQEVSIGETGGGGFGESFSAPAPVFAPRETSYGLPYTHGPELTPRDNTSYGLPYMPTDPISRVGPTASVAPRAALDPNVRAGSLFSGGLPTQANFRAGRGYQAQRSGAIAQLWERLRRRRRGPQVG